MNLQTVYISKAIRKQQVLLGKSGKKGALALSKYHQLFDKLISDHFLCPEIYTKRTKHGEQRIKNCFKYDFGSGYRLVTIAQGSTLFLVFLGTHDVVDQWLERNIGYTPDIQANEWEIPIVVKNTIIEDERQKCDLFEDVLHQDTYEEELQQKLDDSILKHVFSGLFTTQKI